MSFAVNTDPSSDSAYIKSIVEDMNGVELTISDAEDTTQVAVGANAAFDGSWDRMKIENKTLGTFTCIALPKADSTDMLIELRFDSIKNCTTLGLYGTYAPEDDLKDFSIETNGENEILNLQIPNDLVYTFENQILKLSVKKQITSNALQPLVVRSQCHGNCLHSILKIIFF